ncbi:MAG: radical SAM protein, partial [Candidatus Omnitrophica bacterium]|nr:radical SAM protein [Candidatus Omnitrophota bacterium]
LRPPALLLFEPASVCNLTCPFCKLGNGDIKREKGIMKPALVEKIVEEVRDSLQVALFTNWGEPFLNPDLMAMVESVSKRHIYTKINTNGHFIRTDEECDRIVRSGLDDIVIALDGLSADVYLKIRAGGDFNAVKDGIARLSAAKKARRSKTPYLEMLFIVTGKNEHQRSDVPEFAAALGADNFIVKTANLAYVPSGRRHEFLTEDAGYSRYDSDTVTLKEKRIAGCRRAWHSAVVLWDGKVVPCCNDDEGVYEMGNAYNEPFMEIWNGEKYREFRQMLLTDKDKIPMCKNCPGTLLWKSVKYEGSLNKSA